MSQQPRITTTIVAILEELSDTQAKAFEDGVVTLEEIRQIKGITSGVRQTAMDADDGARLGVALIRAGTASTHARRYAADRDLVEALAP